MKDEQFVQAVQKLLQSSKMQGSEVPAYIEILKWLKDLPERLKPKKVTKKKK